MIDDSLTAIVPRRAPCRRADPEVLYGQVLYRYVARTPSEGIVVVALPVEDCAWGADKCVVVCGNDLAVLARTESMSAWREPVCRIRLDSPVVRKDSAAVVARRYNDRSAGRR